MRRHATVLLGLLLVLAGCAATGPVTLPGPTDVKITPPAPSVPAEIAAFSGTWEGAWGGTLASRLIVEEVDNQSARVVYAWDDDSQGRFKGGWSRVRAKVSPGPSLEWGSGVQFKFMMGKDRATIDGEREQGGYISTVTMKKMGQ